MQSNEAISVMMQLDLTSSYEAAIKALSSLLRERGDGSKKVVNLDMMFKYLKILGIDEQIPDLKIIHIAGTKGKGSTCAFTEAILRESGFRTGLFTSPHLIDVRERFRINGIDISKDKFLYYFWDCWNQLKAKDAEDCPMPKLIQFLTLLAFKIFLSEKVDVAIIEVGIGGRFDSTNVVKEPVVCGIAPLGMDHMEILGDTIGKIASEKAGIFKPNFPAFTAPQPLEAMFVLKERASELMIPLEIASPLDPVMLNGSKLGLAGEHQFTNAGLAVALCRSWLQRSGHEELIGNANMDSGLPEAFIRGLSTASLGGRAQIIIDKPENSDQILDKTSGNLIFYLDGAHTPESMEVCARWFCNALNDHRDLMKNEVANEFSDGCKKYTGLNRISKKILLFSCTQVRDPQLLLPHLMTTCDSSGVHFSRALFVPSMPVYHWLDSGSIDESFDASIDLTWQFTLQRIWEKLIHGKDVGSSNHDKSQNFGNQPSNCSNGDPLEKCDPAAENSAYSAVIPSLPLAIKWLRDCATANPSLQLQVLVTGSLHLVGDVLKILMK